MSTTSRNWREPAPAISPSCSATPGCGTIEESTLVGERRAPDFEEWWEPYTLGVGPAGKFVAGLDAARQAELRELCHELLPPAPFVLTASAWAARGIV